MLDIVRDSTLGQALNALFGILPYKDQRPDYVVPSRYLSSTSFFTYPTVVDEKGAEFSRTPSTVLPSGATSISHARTVPEDSRPQSTATFVAERLYPGRDEQNDHVEEGLKREGEVEHYNLDVTPGPGQLHHPDVKHPEYVIVGWDGDDDDDNPRNWTLFKRSAVAGQIMLLTYAVCK